MALCLQPRASRTVVMPRPSGPRKARPKDGLRPGHPAFSYGIAPGIPLAAPGDDGRGWNGLVDTSG